MGYGRHIFEPIVKGSAQYTWLQQELKSSEFQQAKYKIVMFHHPPHSLGDNIVPAYTDPVQIVDRALDGEIKMVRYEYPKQQDYLIRDVVRATRNSGGAVGILRTFALVESICKFQRNALFGDF